MPGRILPSRMRKRLEVLNHRITESQNHRMFGVGRDLCGSSSPTPLLKQSHLQQAAEDLVQAGLEYLQRRRLHNLPGTPSLSKNLIVRPIIPRVVSPQSWKTGRESRINLL